MAAFYAPLFEMACHARIIVEINSLIVDIGAVEIEIPALEVAAQYGIKVLQHVNANGMEDAKNKIAGTESGFPDATIITNIYRSMLEAFRWDRRLKPILELIVVH